MKWHLFGHKYISQYLMRQLWNYHDPFEGVHRDNMREDDILLHPFYWTTQFSLLFSPSPCQWYTSRALETCGCSFTGRIARRHVGQMSFSSGSANTKKNNNVNIEVAFCLMANFTYGCQLNSNNTTLLLNKNSQLHNLLAVVCSDIFRGREKSPWVCQQVSLANRACLHPPNPLMIMNEVDRILTHPRISTESANLAQACLHLPHALMRLELSDFESSLMLWDPTLSWCYLSCEIPSGFSKRKFWAISGNNEISHVLWSIATKV